jgi:polyphosphate kinase
MEATDKFGSTESDSTFSRQEIEYMADREYTPVHEYEPWVQKHTDDISIAEETLLHFPYDNFTDVLNAIAREVDTLESIILSIYRLSDDSDIVALIAYLLRMGVGVTVLLEITAKGNEESNIRYAQQLKLMGAQIIISDSTKKNHAKYIYINRKNDLLPIAMIMTGNLNEVTANIYEDYCLITSDIEITEKMRASIMQQITGLKSLPYQSNKIFFTQENAAMEIVTKIREQIELGENGRIIIKCNLLSDVLIMGILEVASLAGCQIDILCRGECCWKPKGLNKNVFIHRFIHKYLEHSRVYVFGDEVYIGSLDLATHKLYGRFELICKITQSEMKDHILSTLFNMMDDRTERHYVMLRDNNKYEYVRVS